VTLVPIKPIGLADNITFTDPIDESEGRFLATPPSRIDYGVLAILVLLGRIDIEKADHLAIHLNGIGVNDAGRTGYGLGMSRRGR
jgi:hypothetical protein